MPLRTKFTLIQTEDGEYYRGTRKADVFNGTAADEEVQARAGDDQPHGAGGEVSLYGEAGNDELWGDQGDDFLIAGVGDDEVWGGTGNDFVNGASGNHRLRGGAGNDRINGDGNSHDRGSDKIWAEAGNDEVEAGLGDDTVSLGAGSDRLEVEVFEFGSGGDREIGRTTITDFDPARDRLELYVGGIGEDGFSTALFASDFFDSNDDGVIDRRDAEVSYSNGALVLDVNAVLKRAFGPAQTGDEAIKQQGVTSIHAGVVTHDPDVDTSRWLSESDLMFG